MTPVIPLSPARVRSGSALAVLALMLGGLRADPILAPVVFFPPTPPVLGGAVGDRPLGRLLYLGGRSNRPPFGQEDFVGEYSYPALGTRRLSRALDSALESKLYALRSRRLLQVSELLQQFVRFTEQPDDFVERELRRFAEVQTPLLLALENEEELLRQKLVSDPVRNGVDWNAGRRWKLDPRKEHADWADLEGQFQVARAAAYYQKGLLAEQRGLLCELAVELRLASRKARGAPGSRTEGNAIAFSPAGARFRLPASTAPVLREKLASYVRRRAALKDELLDLLIAEDRESVSHRVKACEELADRQWPEISELERVAEALRPELMVVLALKTPPAPPWLPKGLIESIKSYNADRDGFFRELEAATEAALAQLEKPKRTSPNFEDDWVSYQQKAEEAHRAAVALFQLEHGERYRHLQKRHQLIRETLTMVAERQKDPETGRPLSGDDLLARHVASLEDFNTFGRDATMYTHYRIAMLQPGLSPVQRRMLFAYALAGLAQPLPYGEPLPTRSMKKPEPAP